eukprot:TRINITY_DN5278_c0_g1_i1.p1 TRINITY_DN5278_c0_g1~~TRINITY_DN5278_c0_g1_i1.p1  ORF type:complete len:107 (+),score=29.67 TRINITY_DN5278_c0_g1_i1:287-607(+)
MGVGKIAAQAGHASVGIIQDMQASKDPNSKLLLKQYNQNACPKIALKISSYEEMMTLQQKAELMKINNHVVFDAGKTQIPAGSATILSLLGEETEVNKVTGHLKLL